MKKVFIGLIGIALLIYMFSVYFSIKNKDASKDNEQASSTSLTTQTGSINFDYEGIKKELERDKAALEKVKKSFTFKADEFSGSGWYSHKLWGNHFLNRNGLTVSVNKEGNIYLSSNYHDDDWLFHESISVKIGDEVITSETVPTYDKSHITEHSGGSVWEIINFSNNRDNGILSAIASNPKPEVKVRFIGRQYHKDFTLPKNDKLAIEECMRLSNLIIAVKENEHILLQEHD